MSGIFSFPTVMRKIALLALMPAVATIAVASQTAPVNMPLRPADFSDGPHYFVVGTRTADWRLQPEWELNVTADGTAASLSGRLIYQGLFNIARVDTYDDYIHQRYTMYGAAGHQVTADADTRTDVALTALGASQAIRYDAAETFSIHSTANSMLWQFGQDDFTPATMNASTPVVLNTLTVALSADGAPMAMTVAADDSADAIRDTRAFIIGNASSPSYTFSDGISRNLWEMTPAAHCQSMTDFPQQGRPWVQADAQGDPYVDGYGDLVMLTAFDRSWLAQHPVDFAIGQNVPESSWSMTLTSAANMASDPYDPYADLYKLHPAAGRVGSDRIGYGEQRRMGNFNFTEVIDDRLDQMWVDASTTASPRQGLESGDWQCFVAKNVWLSSGHIWSGWGASLKAFDGTGQTTYEEQLNSGFAGISSWTNTSVTASDPSVEDSRVTLYTLRSLDNELAHSTPGASASTSLSYGIETSAFTFGDTPVYLPRVILWYNPALGFDSSVIQFVKPAVAPMIQARYADSSTANEFTVGWNLQDDLDRLADTPDVAAWLSQYTITGFSIDRYRLDDGSISLDQAGVMTSGSLSVNSVAAVNALTRGFSERGDLPSGHYLYKLTVNLESAADGSVSTLEAVSNVMLVRNPGEILTTEATQLMDGSDYTFDLQLKLAPVSKMLSTEIGGSTLGDQINGYVVAVDDITYERLAAAGSVTPAITWHTAEASTVAIGHGSYLPAGTRYFTLDIADSANPAATVVWSNVRPNDTEVGGLRSWDFSGQAIKLANVVSDPYRFVSYIVADDMSGWGGSYDNYDESFGTVIAPTTSFSLGSFEFRGGTTDSSTPRSDESGDNGEEISSALRSYSRPKALEQPDGSRMVTFNPTDRSSSFTMTAPVRYFSINDVSGVFTFNRLPLSSKVLDHWELGYYFYIVPGGQSLEGKYGDRKYEGELIDFDGSALRLLVKDFPIEIDESQLVASLDGLNPHAYIPEGTSFDYDCYLFVAYTSKDDMTVSVINCDHPKATATMTPQLAEIAPTLNTFVYNPYEEKHYDGDTKTTSTLGYFAHGVIDIDLGVLSQRHQCVPYAAYHAQQTVMADPAYNNGCYPYTQGWADYSFAGTSAANGGFPVSEWGDAFAGTSVAIDLYEEYKGAVGDGNEAGDDTYNSFFNNWSYLAASDLAGHLALHINPICQYADKAAFTRRTIPTSVPKLNLDLALIYPVAVTNVLSYEEYNPTTSNRSDATRLRDVTTRKAVTEVPAVQFFISKASYQVDPATQASLATGIDDVTIDNGGGDDQAPAIYHNLQGMRVDNPRPGVIYIVSRGSSVTKELYK